MSSFYDIVLCPLERIGNDIIVGNQDFILNYFVPIVCHINCLQIILNY